MASFLLEILNYLQNLKIIAVKLFYPKQKPQICFPFYFKLKFLSNGINFNIFFLKNLL